MTTFASFSLLALIAGTANTFPQTGNIGKASPPSFAEKHRVQDGYLRSHDDPTPEMIAQAGYPVQTHIVVTKDCYILEMHRIPYGRNASTLKTTRPVIYLQHGLLCSSADWVMMAPDKSLGFLLADAGYDVWLGNFRGNTYSRNHCSLDPDQDEFWEFSWDQMGEFDIPAMIDKILDVTNQSKIHYVGHSMGTTSFIVMANKHPNIQEKIVAAHLLAPVAYMEHARTPLRILAPLAEGVNWVVDFFGTGEFFPSNWLMDWLAELLCDDDGFPMICHSVMFLLCGFDQPQVNSTMLDTIVRHTPAGSSARTVLHYTQEILSKKFSAFDFGRKGNNDAYGQSTPPEYSLGSVTVPVIAYWGENDWLADTEDVLRLTMELPNLMKSYRVDYDAWNHLDFLWAIDVHRLLYAEVLEQVGSY